MLLTNGQIEYAPVIATMHADCFEEKWSENAIRTLLNLPTTIAWLDERGFLLCSRVLDEMEILTIGVLPEYRQQKIASQLLTEMIEWASQKQITKIFLEVSAQNTAAQKLYQKFGFYQTGLRAGYYKTHQGSIDALCLTKDI